MITTTLQRLLHFFARRLKSRLEARMAASFDPEISLQLDKLAALLDD